MPLARLSFGLSCLDGHLWVHSREPRPLMALNTREANSSATENGRKGSASCHQEQTKLSKPEVASWRSRAKPAMHSVCSIENNEPVINIKKKQKQSGEKPNAKKPRHLASLKTGKPGTPGPLCPHDCPAVSIYPHRSLPCPDTQAKGGACYLPASLLSFKILISVGTMCQLSQYFRIQTTYPLP